MLIAIQYCSCSTYLYTKRFVTTEVSSRKNRVPKSQVFLLLVGNRAISRSTIATIPTKSIQFDLSPFSDSQLSEVSARPTIFNRKHFEAWLLLP